MEETTGTMDKNTYELLTTVLGLEAQKAERVASQATLDEVVSYVGRLETATGSIEAASEIAKKGDYLLRSKPDRDRFIDFTLIFVKKKGAYGNINGYLPMFNSLESLESIAGTRQETVQPQLDVSKIFSHIQEYPLLQKGSERWAILLDGLLEDGYLRLKQKGSDRGGGILLAKIKNQISGIFHDAGLGNPQYDYVDMDAREVCISDETRDLLRSIRDEVYRLQR